MIKFIAWHLRAKRIIQSLSKKLDFQSKMDSNYFEFWEGIILH